MGLDERLYQIMCHVFRLLHNVKVTAVLADLMG
jgi:hypothetical protein